MDDTGVGVGVGVGSSSSKMKSLIKIVSKRMTREKKDGEGGEGGGVDADIHIDAIRELINESDKFIIEGKIVRLAEGREGGGVANRNQS